MDREKILKKVLTPELADEQVEDLLRALPQATPNRGITLEEAKHEKKRLHDQYLRELARLQNLIQSLCGHEEWVTVPALIPQIPAQPVFKYVKQCIICDKEIE